MSYENEYHEAGPDGSVRDDLFVGRLRGDCAGAGSAAAGRRYPGRRTSAAGGRSASDWRYESEDAGDEGRNAAYGPKRNDPMAGRMEDAQAKSRNVDRQKKLQADTEKLLSLATELKEQVDKTDKNILSVDVIKKADEIEKLAKSVKDRMKG